MKIHVWEFVNVSEDDIEIVFDNDGEKILIVTEQFNVPSGQSEIFTKQIKPTQLGISYFKVIIPYVSDSQFSLVIDEDKTIPTEQYWEENPSEAPWNNEPEPIPCTNQWCEPEPQLPGTTNSTSTTRDVTKEDLDDSIKSTT